MVILKRSADLRKYAGNTPTFIKTWRMSSCPKINKYNHCVEDHITFDNDCAEYKFQKDILNTAYSNN